MKSVWTAKGSPFGRAGIEQGEMTERASPLKNICNILNRKSLMEIKKRRNHAENQA